MIRNMICNIQSGHRLILDGNTLIYNEVEYELPKRIWNRNSRSLVQNGDTVYIDEYKFKNGKFRFSLIALWNKIF